MNGVVWFTAAAVIVSLAAMAVALRRASTMPVYENREEALERRVADLESTVATLQKLLYQKQQQIDSMEKEIAELRRNQITENAPPLTTGTGNVGVRQVLLACIGKDPMLRSDLAHLRRVQAQTNLRLATLDPVTMADLENMLDRQRLNGTPVRFLHFAVHSDERGLYFGDGLATWQWLSERLDGVDVAVLAGCNNDRVADKLRVVDAVVSVRAREIQNKDASLFVEVFWLAIGKNAEPDQAFEQALQLAPARIGEFVELHL